ncbi:MAG: flagellin lysine-N-methylase [Clostridia bacterium]|nr:flagellin lysine-N-methylase [Clostridia bacterium]
MKLYAPKYYRDFSCIADRCRHSCCIGWEIDVDDITMEKYRSLTHPYGENIRKSIEDGHFRLADRGRCPHLDERGLCRIICRLGEDHLCDICREHPRFYNFTSRGCFVGLGLSCEEACRIILGSDQYSDLEIIGELDGDPEVYDFDAVAAIEKIYSILSDRKTAYSERIEALASAYSLPAHFSAEYRGEILSSLEYLEEDHKDLFIGAPKAAFDEKNDAVFERALACFIFRHCTAARDASEFRAALGFSLFCENLLRALTRKSKDVHDLARLISEELEYSEDNSESIKTEFMF